METLIVTTKDKKWADQIKKALKNMNGVEAIKSFRLKVPFENDEEDLERNKAIELYGNDFVEKIEASEKNFKAGRYKILKAEDLWK